MQVHDNAQIAGYLLNQIQGLFQDIFPKQVIFKVFQALKKVWSICKQFQALQGPVRTLIVAIYGS